MTLLVVISFFLLLYFFSYFTGKINKLEKEISDLKKILNPEKEVFEEIKAEFQEPKTQELSPEKLFFENSEITEKKSQKSRLDRCFIFFHQTKFPYHYRNFHIGFGNWIFCKICHR